VKHFEDFHEDQFDFHQYCIRKVTLRAYTEVLRWEDSLWGEDYYFSAAEGIIQIYLHIADHPSVLDDIEPDFSKMTATERKKAKAIARKKKKVTEKKEEENGKVKGKASPIDDDPEGKELLKLDPLEEAKKYSSILSRHCPNRFGTWTLQYDVAVRRKKWLLALQALYKMDAMDACQAGYVSRLIDFSLKLPSIDGLSEPAKTVLTEEYPRLLKGQGVKAFVTEITKQLRGGKVVDLPYRVAIAEGLVRTGLEGPDAAASLIIGGGLEIPGISVDTCISALASLKKLGPAAKGSTDRWIAIVQERFPALVDLES
jgi:N-alpha-acetyltransferase 15/16, NatA auxiliary subunit